VRDFIYPCFDRPFVWADAVRGECVQRLDITLDGKALVITPIWRGPQAPADWSVAVFDERVKHGKPFTTYFCETVTFEEVLVIRPVGRRVVIRVRRAGYLPMEADIRLKTGKHWQVGLYWDLVYNGQRT
jgi:hypothetical protein